MTIDAERMANVLLGAMGKIMELEACLKNAEERADFFFGRTTELELELGDLKNKLHKMEQDPNREKIIRDREEDGQCQDYTN